MRQRIVLGYMVSAMMAASVLSASAADSPLLQDLDARVKAVSILNTATAKRQEWTETIGKWTQELQALRAKGVPTKEQQIDIDFLTKQIPDGNAAVAALDVVIGQAQARIGQSTEFFGQVKQAVNQAKWGSATASTTGPVGLYALALNRIDELFKQYASEMTSPKPNTAKLQKIMTQIREIYKQTQLPGEEVHASTFYDN